MQKTLYKRLPFVHQTKRKTPLEDCEEDLESFYERQAELRNAYNHPSIGDD